MFGIDAQGVYPIAPTPFTDTGAVDTASTDRMVDWYREIGATGMTILGIMGEAPKLDQSEAIAFARQCIARAKGLPVLVGVSAPGFAAMQALTRSVMDAGAAGDQDAAAVGTARCRRPQASSCTASRSRTAWRAG